MNRSVRSLWRLGALEIVVVGAFPLARVVGGVAFWVGRLFLLGGFLLLDKISPSYAWV
ncbi:MAG: hypothetical protein MPW13_02750 [Candidatus Manganitrophus sp.]|nr:hypothetical protein [Candidatus Manganitrophus sp.]